MSKVNIHYHPETGEIIGHDNSPFPMEVPGHKILRIPVRDGDHFVPNPKTHKVDLRTMEVVEQTYDEQVESYAPKDYEVKAAIAAELTNTDQYMVLDRPISDEKRGEWTIYRQALRDLSKLQSPVDQVKSWPRRPDDHNPITHLTSRIPV